MHAVEPHPAISRILGALLTLSASVGARADTVTDWNQIAIRETVIAEEPPPVQLRTMGIVHAAIFDAVNAIERKYQVCAVDLRAEPGASPDAAVAAAAHGVLERLYPLQKAASDAALAAALAKIPDGPARSAGVRVGQEVAERLFVQRKGDGAAAGASYAFGSGPGVYQPTPPMDLNPILPQWRHVKPFLLKSPKQFPFAGPPAPGSEAFARDLDEVRRLGARTSAERTGEQTAIAIHWAGSEVPPLNAVARSVAAAKGLSLVETARLFALLNMAMADSLVAGFDAKYEFNHWRPITAIRNAPLAKNAAIAPDSGWEPLLVTPAHQEYPSAHSLAAGAAAAVLRHVLEGDRISASWVSPPLGVLRRWQSLSELEEEIGNARVWAGIHFRTAVEHGTRVGRQIGEYAVQSHLRRQTRS